MDKTTLRRQLKAARNAFKPAERRQAARAALRLALRQQLLTAQQDNKQLTTRLDAAKTRLHALLDTLPEDV